jgi:hypothetical protein
MREKHSPVPPASSLAQSLATERHYTVAEVAGMWNLSHDSVRKVFMDEPGVLAFGDRSSRSKRRYTTLRIPESVVVRVHRRLSMV